MRAVQFGDGRRPAVAGETTRTVSRHGRDRPARRDAADDVVPGVRDQQAAVRGRDDSERLVQLGRRRRAAVARVALHARAGDGPDRPVRRDLSDPLVVAVGDQEASSRKRRDAARRADRSGSRRPTVAGEPVHAGACDRRDRSRGGDRADAVVQGVGDDQGAVGCIGDPVREVQTRGGRGAAVAGVAGGAGARDGGDRPVRQHASDCLAEGVGEDEAAAREDGEPTRVIQLRRGRRAAVARHAERSRCRRR